MVQGWIFPGTRALPLMLALALLPACRDAAERGRATVLESGYLFTISDFLRAVAAGQGTVVDQFLAAGMNVNATAPDGKTGLHLAADAAHTHLVQRLLKAGAAVDAVDASGRTPLMAAAGAGDAVSVAALCTAGALVDRQDTAGRTPLMAAASAGRTDVVERLAAASAESLGPVLLLAAAAGHAGVLDGLLQALPQRREPEPDWTALLAAAGRGGHLPALRLLSRRLPAGPDSAACLHAAAGQLHAAGQHRAAAFLEEEGRHSTPDVPEPPPERPDMPASQPVALAGTPGAPPPSEVLPDQPAAADPVPTGRLAGARFLKVSCDTMADLPAALAMIAWEPQVWPVILKDVAPGHESAEVLLAGETASTVTLRVGDEIPGTGCVVEKLRRRRLYTDATESVLKNVSELYFRRLATREVFLASPDQPVLSSESSARLRIAGSSRDWSALPGDEFRIGSLLLRVHRIAAATVELENRLTRERISLPLTPRPS